MAPEIRGVATLHGDRRSWGNSCARLRRIGVSRVRCPGQAYSV